MSEFYSQAIDTVAEFKESAFAAQGRPNPWADLAPSTKKAREKRWGYYKQAPSGATGILHWTGNLQGSGTKQVDNKGGKYTMTAPYAQYHQYGGLRLPQRKVLTLDPQTATQIVKLLQAKIQKDIGNFGLQA